MEDEYGIPIYREPIVRNIQGKKVFLAHGDGLGPGDYGYKVIKKVFNNGLCKWLYARIHPNTGLWIMKQFSHSSRAMTSEEEKNFKVEKEWTLQYAQDHVKTNENIDYYIMGHRHLPIQYQLANGGEYINIGDWLHHYSFGKMENGKLSIEFFETDNQKIYGK
jgi:UDP-2,3-diacylglucosamine hydrolase